MRTLDTEESSLFLKQFVKDIIGHILDRMSGIRSCHQCQVRSTAKMKIPITISAPATIFTKVYVDVMDMTESTQGHKYIVCARDDLSRATECRALVKNDSISLMRFFWEQIYCRYGAIAQVVTDNGSEVKGAFAELLRR